MRVTYIAHSCFLIEWRYSVWLFDHYYGAIPDFDKDKELLIFSSHQHKDHFDPQVLSMFADHPRRTYIFSQDIADLVDGSDIAEEEKRRIVYLGPRTTWEGTDSAGKKIIVHTLRSTDMGVAFLIQYGQDAIYHAGDLNWWAWPQDTEEGARDMASRFQEEIKYLKGICPEIQIAFLPLDGRQRECYSLGMGYFLQNIRTDIVFPMHFWNKYSVIRRFKESHPDISGNIQELCRKGQVFPNVLGER